MRVRNAWLLLVIAVILFMPAVCIAADVIDQEVSPGVKKIYLEPEQTLWDKGDFTIHSAKEGHD